MIHTDKASTQENKTRDANVIMMQLNISWAITPMTYGYRIEGTFKQANDK